jgi:hypothetical protein
MAKKYTQTQLNKIFSIQSNTPISKFKNIIWFNNSNNNSLRLTLAGYNFLIKECKLQSYSFKLDSPITNKLVLQLERYYPTFYFLLPVNYIFTVFEDETTTMLTLLNGDLKKLLSDYENFS